jgi:DNA repair photolyase
VVEIETRSRKPPILTPSAIPCLRKLPTINITEGCALGCTYCYIKGYSHYPGAERVMLYENTPDVLREELRRKRRRPSRVYFSPSSDAFQYLPRVQDVSLQTMRVLLDAGVEIAFLTKGFVTKRFLALFEDAPTMVFAQIGITTLDRQLWRGFEPRTAPPDLRIRYAQQLNAIGVRTTMRLDPLIPDLTDTEANLGPLFEAPQATCF